MSQLGDVMVTGRMAVRAMVLLAVVVAGCSSSGHVVPQHPPSTPAITAQIILPSRTMAAGSSMTSRVIIENNTGRVIHARGCGTLFQVVLTSPSYRPTVAWNLCLHRFTIPIGQSSYPVPVAASYLQCGHSRSPGTIRACLPGGRMPPLPPGDYRATLFQARHLVQAPPGIAVRVIVAAPARG